MQFQNGDLQSRNFGSFRDEFIQDSRHFRGWHFDEWKSLMFTYCRWRQKRNLFLSGLHLFLLCLHSQKRLGCKENSIKYRSLCWKPRSHVRISIYRTWSISMTKGRYNIRQKYSTMLRIFNSFLCVWKCGLARSFVFHISHQILFCFDNRVKQVLASMANTCKPHTLFIVLVEVI